LQDARKDQLSKASSHRRHYITHVKKVLAGVSLLKQGLPKTMMSHLCEDLLGIRIGSDALHIAETKLDEDWNNLDTFSVLAIEECKCVANTIASEKVKAMFDGKVEEMEQFLKEHVDEVCCTTTALPKDMPSEYEKELNGAWMEGSEPQFLLKGLSSFATPSFMLSKRFGYRHGALHVPMTGCASFLYVHAGEMLCMPMSLEAAECNGCSATECTAMLNDMAPDFARAWLSVNCKTKHVKVSTSHITQFICGLLAHA
jgi:hypothetical protein